MKWCWVQCVLIGLLVASCSSDSSSELEVAKEPIEIVLTNDTISKSPVILPQQVPEISPLELSCIKHGLHKITNYDSTIRVRLGYSSTNNFLKEDVYGDFEAGYLQAPYAKRLAKAQAALRSIDSSLYLVVYDAVRPRSVQQKMWDVLDMPIQEKTKFVSNPANGSLHNYGAAVDVSIEKQNGEALDMGTGWDDPSLLSYPRLETAFLDSGMLTTEVVANRQLLRKVMRKGGFWNIQTEWWHFNAVRRDTAKKYFLIVE